MVGHRYPSPHFPPSLISRMRLLWTLSPMSKYELGGGERERDRDQASRRVGKRERERERERGAKR